MTLSVIGFTNMSTIQEITEKLVRTSVSKYSTCWLFVHSSSHSMVESLESTIEEFILESSFFKELRKQMAAIEGAVESPAAKFR